MIRDEAGRRFFLSTLPARGKPRRLALGALGVSATLFLILVPFAKTPLTPVWAFIPVYEAALVVNDLITAVLLFGQFSFLRSKALFFLASGYLFTAFMAVAHALTFPGLFASGGLLGAGSQSTAWLYMFWHGGFPLFVIAYALLKNLKGAAFAREQNAASLVRGSVVATFIVTCAITFLVTSGQDALPAIMQSNHYTSTMISVVSSVWILSFLALIVLWRRRPHTILDLWLMVVMCAWIFDIALSAVFNAGRFDLGFYAGRIYGLLAASLVLMTLLIENSMLYARLAESHIRERRIRRRVQEKTIELMAVNKELESFSYSVSHDLRSPLRAIDGYSQMLEEDYADKLDEKAKRLFAVVRDSAQKMAVLIEDLLRLSRLGRAAIAVAPVDMNALLKEVIKDVTMGVPQHTVIDVAPLPPASADRALLKQVWFNLLSNAVKFSGHNDAPRVEVRGRENGTEIIYSVKDNGVGFNMQYYEKLFGVFQRLHGNDEFPGTGVGLAIVQRVISRHGGRIWAESKLGEGATFYFALRSQPLVDVK